MRLAVCFVLTVLATSSVASAQAPSKSPADSPACSLLTKEDAAAALGEAITKGPMATSMGERTAIELRLRRLRSSPRAVECDAVRRRNGRRVQGDVR